MLSVYVNQSDSPKLLLRGLGSATFLVMIDKVGLVENSDCQRRCDMYRNHRRPSRAAHALDGVGRLEDAASRRFRGWRSSESCQGDPGGVFETVRPHTPSSNDTIAFLLSYGHTGLVKGVQERTFELTFSIWSSHSTLNIRYYCVCVLYVQVLMEHLQQLRTQDGSHIRNITCWGNGLLFTELRLFPFLKQALTLAESKSFKQMLLCFL